MNAQDNACLCPCGSGARYGECCAPLIAGTLPAPTAEALMRARYSAYAKREIPFLLATCDLSETGRDGKPRKAATDEKATRRWSEESLWQGLKIIRTEKGGTGDSEGVVEFEATYTDKRGVRQTHHETASFKRLDGRWLFSNGDLKPETVRREGRKIGRNEPCPCGSGKKHKLCCGR
ncbi:YchJ family protein [Treponema endosymbiont of Eucomonympha sp.]|uniref:YchJ family protein n=1 Tax=Treponema endosymbiont of Eucomonympha sp. TaxID=1580831 RepID=UPI000780251E|nr:YchJ family protein [Treponema endosymbiont of Eucomonympha sp.]